MKRIVSILIAIYTLLSSTVYADNAIYIYRNDGNFNAFFDSEIDSISYSATDTSGVVHSRYVTQLVHTPDSVYRIPLSAIDSIAFTERPVQYNPQVIKLSETYLPYIVSSEGMNITFLSSLPDELRVFNGDILLYEGFSDMFPGGFAGRVTNIIEIESTINVQCEEVAIEEVYEQLTVISDYVLEESPETPSQYRLKQVSPKAEASLSLKLGINIPAGDVGNFSASCEGSLGVRAIISILPNKPFYADLSYTAAINLSGELTLEAKKDFFWNKNKEIKLLYGTAVLPNCPMLKFDYLLAPFCRGELNGSLSAGVEASSSTTSGVIFREGHSPEQYKKTIGDFSEPQLTSAFNISGYVFGGIVFSAYFGTVGNFVGTEMNVYAGPKLEGNLNVDFSTLAEDGIYDAVKDAKVTIGSAIEIEGVAKLKLLKWEADSVFAKLSIKPISEEFYLYPLFSAPTYTQGKEKSIAQLSVLPSRYLLCPVGVGMKLIDNEGNQETRYSEDTYTNGMFWESDYKEDFTGIRPGKLYTCYPMVKSFGIEMRASPSTEFTIEVNVSTGDVLEVATSTAVVGGYGDCLETAENEAKMGIVYSIGDAPSISTGIFVSSGQNTSGEFSVKLTDLEAKTTYNYRACIIIDGKEYYGDVKTFTTEEEVITPGYEIDLGLSVKWSSWNVGASSPEEYGGYYAWGETKEKSNYYATTYKYWQDDNNEFNGDWNYNEFINIGSDISGTQYDVATVKWGNGWRMPNRGEIIELIDNCLWEEYVYNDVEGYKLTGPNGNSIFLPNAGHRENEVLFGNGNYGYYWSSSLGPGDHKYQGYDAWVLHLGSNAFKLEDTTMLRYVGCAVRPVKD